MCGHIVGRDGGGGSVAFLLTSPGRNPMDDADRSWGSGLTSAARQHGVAMWPVHFANDVELRVFAPDDLVSGGLGVPFGTAQAPSQWGRVCQSQASPKIGSTKGTKP